MVISSDNLKVEIENRKKKYKTDRYSMSIGEITFLYKDKEIIINPELQRFFRWNISQKSSFIESILLGIPLPSIFVYQTEGGEWELIDGLQRVSTLLEFMGILRKGEEGEVYPASTLVATEQLQSLEGVTWKSLSQEIRLDIKRTSISVEIIKKELDQYGKFEIFQRLNANRLALSNQEMRNSILVMLNKEFFFWLKELSNISDFKACISIPKRLEQEQYYMELVLRYLVFLHFDIKSKELNSINDFITQKMEVIAKDQLSTFDFDKEKERFERTFAELRIIGENVFKRYNIEKNRYVSEFSESVYDPIVVGVAHNINDYNTEEDRKILKEKMKNIWTQDVFLLANRKSDIPRYRLSKLSKLIPFAKEYFKK